MGRLIIIRTLLGTALVGSVALAQQGLIIEPWRRTPSPPPAALVPRQAMPASGLPGPVAPIAAAPSPVAVVPSATPLRWSPPVVELLVDPWASARLNAPVAQPRWVPENTEIIDPWAESTQAPPPRVAARPSSPPHAAIF